MSAEVKVPTQQCSHALLQVKFDSSRSTKYEQQSTQRKSVNHAAWFISEWYMICVFQRINEFYFIVGNGKSLICTTLLYFKIVFLDLIIWSWKYMLLCTSFH